MLHKWKVIFFILIAGVFLSLSANDKIIIRGKVTDDSGDPLPSVNVFISETYEGTTTDGNGLFEIKTSTKNEITLNATMVGYASYKQKLDITSQSSMIDLHIQLVVKAIQLDEAVVMGSSFSSEKGKGIVVSSLDVMTTPGGAADLFQSLKTMPGLTQVSESAELYVRGGDPNETITIIDQSAIYHPYTYESSYGGLFSNLNTGAIDQMYFSSGGFSSKYGNVLSGVLDIQTKNLPPQLGFSVGVSMAAAQLDAEIPIVQDKLGLRVYSQQSYTKPIMWMNGSLDEFTATPASRNLTSSLAYKISKTGMLKFTGIFADDEQGVNIDRAEFTGAFNGNSKTNFFNLHLSELVGTNTLMKSSLSYNSHDNFWKLGVLDLNKFDQVYKFRTDIEHTFTNELQLLTGAEFDKRKQTYIGVIPSEDYDVRPEAAQEVLNEKIEENRIGAYAELKKLNIFGLQDLHVIAGIRTDHFTNLKITNIDQRYGLGYQFSESSKIRFAFGTFHQVPDFRYYAEQDGNPNLKSMQAYHYVFSYDYEIDKYNSFRAELYHKDYDDLPLEDHQLNYNNNGYGYASGLDLIFKGKFPFGLTGWLSYGYINTKRKWLDFEELTNSSFDITHNLSLILKYNISAMWQIGVNIKYATGRPYTPIVGSTLIHESNIYEPVYGKDNSARYPDYKRLDLRITHLNQLFGKIFTVFYLEALNILDINNLFGFSYNRDYTEQHRVKSYFGRRTIVFGATFTF